MHYSNAKVHVREVCVKGINLQVWFWHYPHQEATEYDPGASAEIEIDSVFVDDVDIVHLCGEQSIKEIEDALFDLFDEGGEI